MNHIASPDTSDPGIERQILAKGLTTPRVTPKTLENNIVHAEYFTAAQGASGAGAIYQDYMTSLSLLTFCVLVLKNGFTVTGESACASPENFNAEIGKQIAFENAKQKIWPLMGYALKQELYDAAI